MSEHIVTIAYSFMCFMLPYLFFIIFFVNFYLLIVYSEHAVFRQVQADIFADKFHN